MFIVYFLAIVSCSEQKQENASEDIEKSARQHIKIQEPGFEMVMEVPEEYLHSEKPEVLFNDNIGLLEVSIGEKFYMEITDSKMDINEFKASLQREQMFDYKISNEDNSGFVFQSFLPDGSEYSTNFIQQFEVEGKIFTAKNKKDKEFSLDQIMKMRKAISSVKTI